MNKVDTLSVEEDNDSDKENMTMTSNTTMISNESNKENMTMMSNMMSNNHKLEGKPHSALYYDSHGNNLYRV
jgi:hypothetical protein